MTKLIAVLALSLIFSQLAVAENAVLCSEAAIIMYGDQPTISFEIQSLPALTYKIVSTNSEFDKKDLRTLTSGNFVIPNAPVGSYGSFQIKKGLFKNTLTVDPREVRPQTYSPCSYKFVSDPTK